MKLNDPIIKAAKPKEKPYKLVDGKGLVLLIQPNGSKWWRYRYMHLGKENMLSLGVYPDVPLADARKLHQAARELLKQGVNPSFHRQEQKTAMARALENTFEAVARNWWQSWRVGRSERHANATMRILEQNLFPTIGNRPIAQIGAPDLIQALKPVASRTANIARRLLDITRQTFRYAIVHGHAERNPANDFNFGDAFTNPKAINYSRISEAELPELLRAIDCYQGNELTRLALQFMALTFVRTKELTNAKWDEIDFPSRMWRIPAERMKKRTVHLVPLADQSIQTLEQVKLVSKSDQYIFHGERDPNKPMHFNTLLNALYGMDYKSKMTGHGFRGLAATILRERQYPAEHVELQLAHLTGNATQRAYDYSQHLPERAQMMQDWADYLDQVRG